MLQDAAKTNAPVAMNAFVASFNVCPILPVRVACRSANRAREFFTNRYALIPH